MKDTGGVTVTKRRRGVIMVMVFAAAFCAFAGSAYAALPKNEMIAVVADGADEQHIASAEAIMVQQLLMSGYKPADEQKMAKLRAAARKSEATRLALQGNVEAILKLGAKYGMSKFTVIALRVQAGQPIENEFKLYTGTASFAVMATASNGARIYADTVSAKQVGYTPDEAAQKSIEAASKLAVSKMVQ